MRHVKILGLAVLLVIAFGIASARLFARGEDGITRDEFSSEFNRTQDRLLVEYDFPEQKAIAQMDPSCKQFPIRSDIPDCTEFVETIREIDAELATAIADLDRLYRSAPPDMPQSVKSSLETQLMFLNTKHYSNQLRLEGWETNNADKWRRGWELRESLHAGAGGLDEPTRTP